MTDQYQQNNINVPRGSRLFDENANLTLDDDLVVGSTVLGDITLTLPRAQQIPGQEITFKANDAGTTGNPMRISAFAGENIDGAGSVELTEDQQSICLKSDGENWRQVCSDGGGETCCAPQVIAGSGITIPLQTASFVASLVGCNLTTVSTLLVKENPLAPPAVLPIINSFLVTPGTVSVADQIDIDFDSSGASGAFVLEIQNPCGCCTVVTGIVIQS